MSLHRAVFTELVKERGWETGAELGVDKGILFRMLLVNNPQLSLLGVDLGLDLEKRGKCQGIAQTFGDRARYLVMSTRDAAGMVPDGSLDFVFIDADHSERAVCEDIERWRSKVKSGGWLGGHDYHERKWPGVVRAVNKYFGKKVQFWPGTIWGVQC